MDEDDDDYFQSASHAQQMMLKMDAYFDKQQVTYCHSFLFLACSSNCVFHFGVRYSLFVFCMTLIKVFRSI